MSNVAGVSLLGTYHMNNPRLDKFNMAVDDVLSDKRQEEIIAVINNLAKFKPTKIALEVSADRQSDLDEMYQKYIDAEGVTEKRNEQFQVGFRLARKLGHDKIYAIDVHSDMNLDSVVAYSMEHGPHDFPEKLQNLGQSVMAEFAKRQAEYTVGELLKWFNQPDSIQLAQQLYMDVLRVGNAPDYIGASVVADWYARNLKIFTELTRITSAEDSIIVLYGQGHIPILQQCIRDSDFMELVPIMNYL